MIHHWQFATLIILVRTILSWKKEVNHWTKWTMAGSVGDVNNYRRPFPTVITLNYIVYIVNFFLAAFGWKSVAPWEPPEGTFWGTLWAFLRIVGQNSLVLPIFNQLTLIYIWVCLNIEYNPPNGCFKREYDNQPMVILMGTVFSDKPIFFLFLFFSEVLATSSWCPIFEKLHGSA